MLKILFLHYAIKDKEGFGRTYMLARELAFKGHLVTLMTNQPSEKFIWPYILEIRDNVRILAFPDILPNNFRRTGFVFFSSILKLVYILRHHDFNIVHSDTGHRPSAAIPALFAQKCFGIPHMTEWWDDFGKGGQYDEKSLFKKLTHGSYDLYFQKPFIKLSDQVAVLSEYLKKKALNWQIPEERVTILHGGADDRAIPFMLSTIKSRKSFGIQEDAFVFGFIGMNSGELNDVIPFVQAINRIKDDYPVKWFTTGGLLSENDRKVNSIGDDLYEFGWQSYEKYVECLSTADAFILLQRESNCNEARWPNKLGDYLAAGRPVLCNTFGDMKGLADKYPSAFITTTFDVESIANKIIWMINNKDQLRMTYPGIRDIAVKHCSWSAKANNLLTVYLQMNTSEN